MLNSEIKLLGLEEIGREVESEQGGGPSMCEDQTSQEGIAVQGEYSRVRPNLPMKHVIFLNQLLC